MEFTTSVLVVPAVTLPVYGTGSGIVRRLGRHPLQAWAAGGTCTLAVERAVASGARADDCPPPGPGAACVCAFKGTLKAGPAVAPRRRVAISAAAALIPRPELPVPSRAVPSVRGRSAGSTGAAPAARALPVLEGWIIRGGGGNAAASAPLVLLRALPGRSSRLASREAAGATSPAGDRCRGDSAAAGLSGGGGLLRLPSPRGDAGEAARGGERVCGRGEGIAAVTGARAEASSAAVAAGGGGAAGVSGAAAARAAS